MSDEPNPLESNGSPVEPIDSPQRKRAGLTNRKNKIIGWLLALLMAATLIFLIRSTVKQTAANARYNDSLAVTADTALANNLARAQAAVTADSLRQVAQQKLLAEKATRENKELRRLAAQAQAQADGRLSWRLKSFLAVAGLPWWFVAIILAITLFLFMAVPKKSKLLPAWLFIGCVVVWMTLAFLQWPPRPLKLEMAQAQDPTKTAKDDALLAELNKYRQQDSTRATELQNVYSELKVLNNQMAHIKTANNRPPIASASNAVATTVSLSPPVILMANGSQLPAHPVQLSGTPVAANAIDPPAGLMARDKYSTPVQQQQAIIQPQPAAAQSGQTNAAQPVLIDPPVWPAK